MAATLEWVGDRLVLGGADGWTLGALRKEFGHWRFVLNRTAGGRTNYERKEDAAQDGEAEVRRLLRDAGVEVE